MLNLQLLKPLLKHLDIELWVPQLAHRLKLGLLRNLNLCLNLPDLTSQLLNHLLLGLSFLF